MGDSRKPRSVGRRRVLAAAGALLAAPAIVRAQTQGNGVALVIGNSKYRWEAPLPNVHRDAPDVAKRFQAIGLRTELLQDVGQDAMRAATDKFASASRGANLAAFYFAGHGASWDNDTYLVPADADLGNSSTVQSLLPVRSISSATKEAQHRLLVFDNCRNNPADGWRQREALKSSSVARTELTAAALNGPNTLVLFSTAPGRAAVDGPAGENSPFAAMFLRQLTGQSVDLQVLPANLRRALLIATDGQQVLWDQNTYDQPFVLANPSGRPLASARNSDANDAVLPRTSSQIVELNTAYAFAREKGLLLPPGLIALRLPNGTPDSQKIGSYKTTTKVGIGSMSQTMNFAIEPLLLVVLSVPNSSTAEIIFSTRDWDSQHSWGANGKIWRYSTATLSGPRLGFEYSSASTGRENPHEFKWRDADSGIYTARTLSQGFYSSPFTRLD